MFGILWRYCLEFSIQTTSETRQLKQSIKLSFIVGRTTGIYWPGRNSSVVTRKIDGQRKKWPNKMLIRQMCLRNIKEHFLSLCATRVSWVQKKFSEFLENYLGNIKYKICFVVKLNEEVNKLSTSIPNIKEFNTILLILLETFLT